MTTNLTPISSGLALTERINAAFDQVMEERENRNVSEETADRLLGRVIAVRSALFAATPRPEGLDDALALIRELAEAKADSGTRMRARSILARLSDIGERP